MARGSSIGRFWIGDSRAGVLWEGFEVLVFEEGFLVTGGGFGGA